MPVHDWVKVDAGTFHHFHTSWITHLSDALNAGLLPDGYYAMSEQHAGRMITDVLTLHVEEGDGDEQEKSGRVALADAPPRVTRKQVASPNAAYRASRRTLVVRHVSGHQIVALLEILSPANKDRRSSVEEFVQKLHSALKHGCHVLMLDLFRPGAHDPLGMHGAVWEAFDENDYDLPVDRPLTLAAYNAGVLPEAYLEHLAFGDALQEMPLFLDGDYYVNVPLETTYQAAYRGVPAYWRGVIERP